MRIKKIILTNYRQFRKATLDFGKGQKKDLYVIIGRNGTGKTNLLNAINWCFYGTEPHLARNSQMLPMLNLQEIDNSSMKSVKVEVFIEIEGNEIMRFIREKTFKLYGNTKEPTEFNETFTLYESGNQDILKDEEASAKLNRLFPKDIKEFFFFDGEKLDKYFQENQGAAIKDAIFNISQLNILERIERNLEILNNDLRRELGNQNPRIDALRAEREEKENALNDINSRIETTVNEINEAKSRIKGLREKLSGYPDVEKLEKSREEIQNKYNEKSNMLNNKKKEKQKLIFEAYKSFALNHCIREGLDLIEAKEKNKEIPPTNDKTVLENSLKRNKCLICGRVLDEESDKYIQKIIRDTKISTEIAQILLLMKQDLLNYKEIIDNFPDEHVNINKEINVYNNDLSDYSRQLEDIHSVLGKHNIEQIRLINKDYRDLEERMEDENQDLGSFRFNKERITEEIQKLDEDIKKEADKMDKAHKIQGEITFCTKSYDVVTNVKAQIMQEIKDKIEKNTKDLFLNLVWKRNTFGDVKIDDSYNISVIHSLGYDCVGSLGAAERELLTLSFIIALHRVSGFDSPLLIDTPVARVSDTNRENLGKIFDEISDNKQVILLFTPDEYSEEISKLLDKASSKKCNLVLSQNEKETIFKEV